MFQPCDSHTLLEQVWAARTSVVTGILLALRLFPATSIRRAILRLWACTRGRLDLAPSHCQPALQCGLLPCLLGVLQMYLNYLAFCIGCLCVSFVRFLPSFLIYLMIFKHFIFFFLISLKAFIVYPVLLIGVTFGLWLVLTSFCFSDVPFLKVHVLILIRKDLRFPLPAAL